MLAKNTRVSVTTVILAMVIGTMTALWLAFAPEPAQAQSGDVLRLLSIKSLQTTGDEGDGLDEIHLRVNGSQVWSGGMRSGQFVSLAGISVPLTGDNADVQLWEADTGHWPNFDDGPVGFLAAFTGGDQRAQSLTINSSWGQNGIYEITYVVDRPIPGDPNDPPQFGLVKPTGRIHDRTPLIKAVVRDAETNLTKSNITTFKVDNRAKTFEYDTSKDTVVHSSGKLALGRHTVTVTADDGQDSTTRVWSFRIVR
jgi:hypothetical protein